MPTRGLPVLLRCGCLLAVAISATAAAGQDLHWGATIGFGGAYKEGCWAPVFVDIANQGDSQTGEIMVPLLDPSRANREAIIYSRPVEAPRNSKKRYVLYVPSDRVEKVALQFGRRFRYEQQLSGARAADRNDALVVVLGGDRGLLNFLQGAQAAPPSRLILEEEPGGGPGGGRQSGPVIQVGRAEWQSLPDSWLGWDGVDAVVLGDAGFAAASQESVEALLRWVEIGGTLVVAGGALAPQLAASPIGRMLPFEVQGTTSASGLEALASWAGQPIQPGPVLLALGPLAKGASVLCGSVEEPLIALRPFGAGRIAMTSFDYTSAPVKYWDGQTAMWQRLIAQAAAPPSVTQGAEASLPYDPQIALADAATYTPAAALPPFWLLLGFLAAYIIVLVPVNYAVLKRWDRRELAWVTTPVIVIVFTLGAYAVGYGMRGGQTELNRLAVIETARGGGLARGRGYVGIFSPGRMTFDLLLKGTAASARDLSREGERTRGPARVVYGPEPKVADIGMNMWTSRRFGVEFLADLKGGLGGDIEYDGKELRARIRNDTGHRLRGCRLVHGNSQTRGKDIAAGDQAVWVLGALSQVADRSRYSGSQPTQLDVKEGMQELAIRSLFGSFQRGAAAGLTTGEPCFVAFVDDPMVPVELNRRGAKTNDLGIIVARLPVRLASGRRLGVPKWMVAGRPVASDGAMSGGEIWDPQITLHQGTVVFEFRVPVGERGGQARVLTLSAASGQGGPGQPLAPRTVAVSAFNNRLNTWERVPGGPSTARLPNAPDCMTRDGRVLVKIEALADNVTLWDVGLAGQVETF
ncbi:MAG: hypothetical protein ACE149_03555 [Armatimonadota bacterium]